MHQWNFYGEKHFAIQGHSTYVLGSRNHWKYSLSDQDHLFTCEGMYVSLKFVLGTESWSQLAPRCIVLQWKQHDRNIHNSTPPLRRDLLLSECNNIVNYETFKAKIDDKQKQDHIRTKRSQAKDNTPNSRAFTTTTIDNRPNKKNTASQRERVHKNTNGVALNCARLRSL